MLTSKRFWLGLIVSLVFLGLLFYRVDLSSVGDSLRGANYLFLLPAIAVYFVSVWFRTLRWQYLLRNAKAIPQGRLYPIVVVGYMANNLLPVRLGELVRVYFLGTKEGVSKTTAFATILVERTFDGITLLLLALAAGAFIPLNTALRGLGGDTGLSPILVGALASLPFILVLGGLLLIAGFPKITDALAAFGIRLAPRRQRGKLTNLVNLFMNGLDTLRSPGRIFLLLLLSVPIWLAEAIMYYLISFSFALSQPFSVIVLVTSAANLAIIVPSSGGGIGPFEWATKTVLIAFGEGASLATAYAIILHATLLAPVTVVGLILLWTQGINLGEIVRSPEGAVGKEYSASGTPLKGEVKK